MLKQYAPEDWVKDQVKRFLVNNLPAIGVDANQGFFSQEQVNLAGVEMFDSSAGLDKNMGKAGLPHYDPKDDPQGYTCMFATSNTDECGDNIHPGFFHFLELGLFVRCNNFRLVFFSGLHFHGGSPPRAMKDFSVPSHYIRYNNILYPNNALSSGTISTVICVSSGGASRIENKPCARYDPKAAVAVQQGPLNYMRDGTSIMSEQAYLSFITREAALHLENMFRQSELIGLNYEALKVLFVNKSSNEPVDFWSDWKYAPDKFQEEKDDMLGHHNYLERKKLDVCMTVPTQIRRLYNSNQIKLVKGEDGYCTLQINDAVPQRTIKKHKG